MKRILGFLSLVIAIFVLGISCSSSPPPAAPGLPDYTGVYSGVMLGGNIVSNNSVDFTLWAPNASTVQLAGDFTEWQRVSLINLSNSGLWYTNISISSPHGQKYCFIVDGNGAADPYAKANVWSTTNSILIDPSYSWGDSSWSRPSFDELVIYEMHVASFTSHSSSGVSAENQGKFIGITEKTDYLNALGVNAVELMPISECGNFGYTWGYETVLFFAPESDYASDNDGVQVAELQETVDKLHQADIAVILDMVYNHTDNNDNHLWTVDNLYYFDYDEDGTLETSGDDSTPWGNRLATGRPMVKKLMYDNMKYFIDHLHIDGFRLDATSYMNHDGLKEVIAQLKSEYPDVYFIAEQLPNSDNFKGTGIAQWSDPYHDKMKAMLIMDDFSGYSFDVDEVAGITYFSKDWNFPASPLEVINYYESHDENSVYHEALVNGPLTTFDEAAQASRMAAVHLFTAMGTPMFMSGAEYVKDREGQDTSEANGLINWSWTNTEATNTWDFYSELIHLRKKHPALRLTSSDPASDGTFRWSITPSDWSLGYPCAVESSGKTLGYQLNVDGSISDNQFVVAINFGTSDQVSQNIKFPSAGSWDLICDGSVVNTNGISTITVTDSGGGDYEADVTIPARSGMIFMK